jgi:hypothetical protein
VELDQEHEIEVMFAERSITRVINAYAHAADRGDASLMESLFWPDAVLDIGIYQGDVRGFMTGFVSAQADTTRVTNHFQGNILIEVRRAEHVARAETYCIGGSRLRNDDGSVVDRLAHVRYVDRFEERSGEWRIRRRVVVFDWSGTTPVTSDDLPKPHYVTGKRGPTDTWHHILD